jgi:PDZ domain
VSEPTPILPAGYLGLIERSIEVDWKAVHEHGPCVIVEPRSPAWKAGLRSGDFIVSINGVTYEAFHSILSAAGTAFTIIAWRNRVGKLTAIGRLGTKPKSSPECPSSVPATLAGKPVTKKERPLFVQGFISDHPDLEAIDTRLLSRLLNYEGPKGIIPKRETLARDLCCSLSTIDRSLRRCKRGGVLRVASGKSRGKWNTYFVTWPLSHPKSHSWRG